MEKKHFYESNMGSKDNSALETVPCTNEVFGGSKIFSLAEMLLIETVRSSQTPTSIEGGPGCRLRRCTHVCVAYWYFFGGT